MRFCDEEGKMDVDSKGDLDSIPDGYLPWFQNPREHDSLQA